MRIAMIAGAYRPMHSGHFAVIERASRENDEVYVFASTKDRARKGELTVSGETMTKIWRDQIEPILPSNVHVVHSPEPVKSLFERLATLEEQGNSDSFFFYADPADAASVFKETTLAKVAPKAASEGRLSVVSVPRTSTVDVSGTKMRKWLEAGDRDAFVSHLPQKIMDKDSVWHSLKREHSEHVLRTYVTECLTER